jgi:hypothetical protein
VVQEDQLTKEACKRTLVTGSNLAVTPFLSREKDFLSDEKQKGSVRGNTRKEN